MRESYDEGVASHIGPESCGGGSNAMAEALTGVRAGQVLSREMHVNSGVLAIWVSRNNTRHVVTRDMSGPCAVGDLGAYGNTLHGNREILCPPLSEESQGRIGKSKDTIQ